MLNWLKFLWSKLYDFFQSLFGHSVIHFPFADVSIELRLDPLQTQIGEGAFSVVWRVNQVAHKNRHYAVKRMLLQSPDCMRIAQTEIDAFNRFRHINILSLLDCTEINEGTHRVTYLLLPFCSNGSLRSRLNLMLDAKVARPPLRTVLSQFRDICEALNVLHLYQPSYVHQDIKPDNILLDDHLKPLLTDFGSVRRADVVVNSRNDVSHSPSPRSGNNCI
jgi:serine/threonine protein kinase